MRANLNVTLITEFFGIASIHPLLSGEINGRALENQHCQDAKQKAA